MEKPKLVLDTNVVLSATLKPDGLQRLILQLALSPFCELFISAPILEEYEEVLRRKRFKLPSDEVDKLIDLIKNSAVMVTPTKVITASRDADDNKFLECAEEANADYIVTGNKKHFPAKWKKTKVVNGREMMDLMLRGLLEL